MTEKPLSLRERLQGLSSFLPSFEEPSFVFGLWEQPKDLEPGVVSLPYYIMSETVEAFLRAAYDLGWVQQDFDWSEWKETPEALCLRDEEDSLASASPDQLAHLLTVVIRQERFCEGALDSAYQSGLLTRILRRVSKLESEIADKKFSG